ncbi:hypothetical protein GCM10010206_61170 [Streptomyces cinerochromogenes]|uniref:hypothetical protein n=1 Tax=Streptomyces cinerochromogenes TaxID=66422 RepID=UPI0016707955|nr:hypothetical protein [Streptomyces cinerochromogenes]GGS90158.1 hypothetical protein GCM10010206_61170 [Streptomyces cinerochromogenes]
MEAIAEVGHWQDELESVFARVVGRFAWADLRRRMRDYIRGLPAQVGRKNGWQLAEWAGHRDPAGLEYTGSSGKIVNWPQTIMRGPGAGRHCGPGR